MVSMTPFEALRMLFKIGFETQPDIMPRNNRSKGPPVIKIADTL